jgi:hypothetical protein
MFRWSVIIGLIIFITGCSIYKPEPQLQVDNSWQTHTVVTAPQIQPKPKIEPNVGYIPREWFPPNYLERRWAAIVVHHSATDYGNAAIFDKWHREGNHWEGVGYDFVIGNGTNSANGQVEVTFRWRQQKTGAHCKTPDNWANEKAIGICLVGDFNKTVPTPQQMQSLVNLSQFLQKRYGIPAGSIYGHKNTPGARSTDCPGRNFPMSRLKSML